MPNISVIQAAQEYLTRQDVPGWLVYDYRHSNPIFWQVVTTSGHVTRPCFLYIPKAGPAQLLVHHVDAGKFADTGIGLLVYDHRQAMIEKLGEMLSGAAQVAMEYSPQNALPRVSKVDAGTIELVRELGIEVVSSADLTQYATQRWTPDQLQSHCRSAAKLGQIVNQAFQYIGEHLAAGPTEFDVAEFIRRRFADEGFCTASDDIEIVELSQRVEPRTDFQHLSIVEPALGEVISGHANADDEFRADPLPYGVDHAYSESQSIIEFTAVFVIARVHIGRPELVDQMTVARHDFTAIESAGLKATRSSRE